MDVINSFAPHPLSLEHSFDGCVCDFAPSLHHAFIYHKIDAIIVFDMLFSALIRKLCVYIVQVIFEMNDTEAKKKNNEEEKDPEILGETMNYKNLWQNENLSHILMYSIRSHKMKWNE